jgi:hypothetical protein
MRPTKVLTPQVAMPAEALMAPAPEQARRPHPQW